MFKKLLLLFFMFIFSTSIFGAYASTVISALELENNMTDEQGNYTFTYDNSLYSNSIYKYGSWSAGQLDAGKLAYSDSAITEEIKTVQFFIYMATAGANSDGYPYNASNLEMQYKKLSGLRYQISGYAAWTSYYLIALDTWFRINLVFDGTDCKMYVDGVERLSLAQGGYVHQNTIHYFFNWRATGYPANCYMDRIVLADTEIPSEIAPLTSTEQFWGYDDLEFHEILGD